MLEGTKWEKTSFKNDWSDATKQKNVSSKTDCLWVALDIFVLIKRHNSILCFTDCGRSRGETLKRAELKISPYVLCPSLYSCVCVDRWWVSGQKLPELKKIITFSHPIGISLFIIQVNKFFYHDPKKYEERKPERHPLAKTYRENFFWSRDFCWVSEIQGIGTCILINFESSL